jgi:hypothetical protein
LRKGIFTWLNANIIASPVFDLLLNFFGS